MISVIKNYFVNANLIIPKNNESGTLWLGNYKSALDSKFLIDNNISVIINVSKDMPFIYEDIELEQTPCINHLETLRIPVDDSRTEKDIILMEQYYPIAIPFVLQKLIIENKNVLIHCHAGAQRSSSLVVAILYVILLNSYMSSYIFNLKCDPHCVTKEELMKCIINYVLERRPQSFTFGYRINFKKSLERYFQVTI